jgi:hypothetical protein
MDFWEFDEVLGMLASGLKTDFKNEMTLHSFGAWQIIEVLKAVVDQNAKPMNFNEYLKALGLDDENKKLKSDEIKKQKEDALRKAEHIVKLFKQQQGAKK